jgi:ADP-ribose pyrophosphatase YjhB (NUDIX family)
MEPETPKRSQIWRPPPRIRAKVIAVARYEERLLLCEVLDDFGLVAGWCPLGGEIEFCEPAEHALRREIREELGCDLEITHGPAVCENFYEHHGSKGHEIVFAYKVRLFDPEIYARKRFQIREQRGTTHWVDWVPIHPFRDGQAELYPTALVPYLVSD